MVAVMELFIFLALNGLRVRGLTLNFMTKLFPKG